MADAQPSSTDFSTWPDAGVYQLWLRVTQPARVRVGRLGLHVLPAGLYVYTGRASRNLPKRVLRHVRGANRLHWHIDYLLAHRRVQPVRVVLASTDPDAECVINQAVPGTAAAIVPGFGASDCRRGCAAHLWRIGD